MTSIEPYRDTLGDEVVLQSAWRLAQRIAITDFAPAAMKGKPEAVMGALLMGREIGLGPMASLTHIHVIEGKPCLDAVTQRALVLAAGHDIWVVDSNTTTATVAGKRRGSEVEQRVTWTLDDAKKAGLDRKSNWTKYPRQMLVARATAEVARLVGADALGGVPYTIDELQDEKATPRAGRGRQKAPQAPPDPAAIDAVVIDDKPAKRTLSDSQRFAMDLGLEDNDRHSLYEIAIGQTGARYGDLDADDLKRVKDWAGQVHRGELVLERLLSGPALSDPTTDQVVAYHDATAPPPAEALPLEAAQ